MGVMLVAVTAVLIGLTLLPALMSVIGKRIEWLRVIPRRPRADPRTVIWYRLSQLIMHRPWPWLLGSIAVLSVIAFPVHSIATTGADTRLLPSNLESVVGVKRLNAAFGANRLTPIQVVVKTRPDGVWTPEFLDAIAKLSQTVAADSSVEDVQSLYTISQNQGMTPDQYHRLTPAQFPAGPPRNSVSLLVDIDGRNDAAVVNVYSRFDQFDSRHQDTISRLRATLLPEALNRTGYSAYVGGAAAGFLDFRNTEFSRFPAVVGAVLLVTFVMLMMFFQSLFLPLKAILMNVASIVAAYGGMVAIFVYGWGASVLGFESNGHLSVVTPPILFAVLFGLSADYEVFMLSRVKELYHQNHDNTEAVAGGLARTAGVITAAALLLMAVFGSFSVAGVQNVKEVGVGLAIGVVLDTTVVRIIMVPATMRLLGDANWWMPRWLKGFVPQLKEGPTETPEPVVAPVAATAVVAPPSARLRAIAGAPANATIELLPGRSLRIGRDGGNDLQLLAPQVSRFHSRIDATTDGHAVTDLNSLNGTFVNGRRIAASPASHPLNPGDRIQFAAWGPEAVYEVAPVHTPAPAS
jgi:RND superfamily putative drug exporter